MGSRLDNTIIVIPSFNESKTIGGIVLDLVKMGLSVLVVDDGSTDNTERIALDSGAMVIRHKENQGKGFSVREGIKHVFDKTNFEWMVIMDGDGQHHTEDVPSLMKATQGKDVELIIGNRMMQTENMPVVRYLTNRFMSWLISRICDENIPDTQCGFRLLKVDALKRIRLTTKKYDIESEMLILAAENKMKIESVPIRTIYGEEVSQINPIRDTIKFFKLVIKYHFRNKKDKKDKKNEK